MSIQKITINQKVMELLKQKEGKPLLPAEIAKILEQHRSASNPRKKRLII